MKGKSEPRIYTEPLRELTPETSLGFAFIEWCREVCHVDLIPWQKWLAVHAMEILGDFESGWSFRFRTILVLVARQNGKSFFLELLALFFMFVLEVQLVLGTAQNLDTAEEVWESAVERAESSPEMSVMIERVRKVNGGKTLELTNNSKYKIVSATRQGARGKRSDLVIMDELREQRSWDGWSAVSKTMMARPNAMLWGFSNAGDSTSVVLRHLRMTAHVDCGDPDGIASHVLDSLPDQEDVDDSLAIFEWSAVPDCDTADRDGWAQANPSLGYGFFGERALKSALKTDPEHIFRTECLCQWVESITVSAFPDGSWESGTDQDSHEDEDAELFWGIDISSDRTTTALAFVGKDSGGFHGEVEAYRTGFDWVLKKLTQASKPIKVAIQGRGAPISSHIDELESIKGVELILCEGRDVSAWCGRFYDAVVNGSLSHIPQPALDYAAREAQTRPIGDSAWTWDRKSSSGDISPLVALTMAYGLATVGKTETRYKTAYEARGVLTV